MNNNDKEKPGFGKLLTVFCIFFLFQFLHVSVAQERTIEIDSLTTTDDEVTIRGERIRYTAAAGTQPVWDEDGKAVASLFYVYCQRSEIDDTSQRPLVFSFNGGPGSDSVWMHIGYTGPRFLNIDDEGFRRIDRSDAGDRYDHDPALTSWNHSFTHGINYYIREHLGYETDLQYNIFGPVHPWDRSEDSTGDDLRGAMAQNPYLNVMVQAGYYDGATDYFSAKYTMWNMDPGGKLRERIRFEGYRSGHMMYLRQEDLETSNQHIREFILDSIPADGEPAKY